MYLDVEMLVPNSQTPITPFQHGNTIAFVLVESKNLKILLSLYLE